MITKEAPFGPIPVTFLRSDASILKGCGEADRVSGLVDKLPRAFMPYPLNFLPLIFNEPKEKSPFFGAFVSGCFRWLQLCCLVGVRGFEPPTPASRTQYSTRLSYTPTGPVARRSPAREESGRAEPVVSVVARDSESD